MFFRKYKILGSSLIVAACISISFPSQASMTPMQNNYTLKGLSQHQQRETSAVIALKTDNDDNTFDKKETSNHSVSEKIAAILKGDSDKKEQNKVVNYGSSSIMGSAIATREQCVNYLLKNNPNPKITVSAEELVDYYYEEAGKEGIRPDAAFAQALKETGFFRYGGTVIPDQNNYCGLGTTSATVKGAYFETARIGVRAHIQHLLAYASVRPPREDVVDPRYSLVRAVYSTSTIDTWPGLNGRWAVPGNNYGQEILQLKPEALIHIIARSCEIKADVVSKDECEAGLRAILNFGHTLGHAIEKETNYAVYNHGEAVAIGMVGASKLSFKLGLISQDVVDKMCQLLANMNLPLKAKNCDAQKIYQDIFHDKKTVNGKINWVLLEDIGKVCIKKDVPEKLVKETILEIL